jgi:hypothetical protein
MKRIVLIAGFCSVWLCNAQSSPKQTTDIKRVVGAVNNTYSLVQTIIYRDTPAEGAGEAKTIVTRRQVGEVGPFNRLAPLSVPLDIPMLDAKIKTYGAPQLVNKLGALVGAVGGPKTQIAGVGISTMGVIAQYATDIAEQELNEAYGTQEYKFTILEIIPVKYYRISKDNHKIEVTDDFVQEFPKYQKQLMRYKMAFEIYGLVNKSFIEWVQFYRDNYARLVARNPKAAAQQAQLIDEHYATVVKPALEVKNREERALANLYPPYRIAIMASPTDPGKDCGPGKGPWELTIVYYIGAQQTNEIGVKFCVPNPKDNQRLQISLVHNSINKLDSLTQEFVAGGIKLVQAVNDPSGMPNINFAKDIGYGATETGIFNWFTSMVTSVEGGDIGQFLVPFDIHNLKKAYAADEKAKKDAQFNAVLSSMDHIIVRAEKARTEMKAAEDKAKQMGERGEYGSGSKSYENQFKDSFGEGHSPFEEDTPPNPGIETEDEDAVMREVESKGKVLDQDLGDTGTGEPPVYPGGEVAGGETPPPYPGAAATATAATPKPGSVAYSWRDVAKAQAERDDLARDILALTSVPGVDIPLPSSLQEKWSPTNKTGVADITRYTEYFRALQAKDIKRLDDFLSSLNLGYKANPVETTIWANKAVVMEERKRLAADIQTIKNMDPIPENVKALWHPDRMATLNEKMRYREYFTALIAKNISGVDSLLRSKGYQL